MGRLLGLLLALALFGQATGIVHFVIADECERRCAKSESGDQPDPGCDLCPCCTPVRHVTLGVESAFGLLAGFRIQADAQRLPTAPEPNEIPHVPKLA
jgi:hypothetical protein